MEELERLINSLETVNSCKSFQTRSRLLRRVWVVQGVLDHDLNLSLLEKIS